jgi:hypothetical protein
LSLLAGKLFLCLTFRILKFRGWNCDVAYLPWYDVIDISLPKANFCFTWRPKHETRYLSDRPHIGLYVHRTLQLQACRPTGLARLELLTAVTMNTAFWYVTP